ncbi:MAG: geranylgeranylglyceryl/heptaprenylglyceryl phosphate synthase [Thermoprotei archaeon]|nr:MAG: geranylgeranylglyceryl/heptaprenylglyceryl phosphate synthase [Thermoprotei archaeon]HDJ97075.1 geranylgeranylglyceryl/heptaprenylglyceryl phosphate synthase [Thermofilum sp.]
MSKNRYSVSAYLHKELEEKGAIHMALIDPANVTPEEAYDIAKMAQKAGTSAIMVGGSIGVDEHLVDDVVLSIKRGGIDLPIILFPGNPSALSRYADAVWFLSVLNSLNPYFIVGGQMQAAPLVKKYKLEPLSLAYLILGEGGAVGYVSQTRPIPFEKPEIAAAYSLAAEYMGFEFIYLEGGSGGRPIPPEIIKAVKSVTTRPIIVGGGIRTPELAARAVNAGASIIVTGNIIEESENVERALREIIQALRKAARRRKALYEPALREP